MAAGPRRALHLHCCPKLAHQNYGCGMVRGRKAPLGRESWGRATAWDTLEGGSAPPCPACPGLSSPEPRLPGKMEECSVGSGGGHDNKTGACHAYHTHPTPSPTPTHPIATCLLPAAHLPHPSLPTVLFSWSSILSAAAGRTCCMCGAVGRLQGGGQSPGATRSSPPTTSLLQPPRPPTRRSSPAVAAARPRCCAPRPPRPRPVRGREMKKYR